MGLYQNLDHHVALGGGVHCSFVAMSGEGLWVRGGWGAPITNRTAATIMRVYVFLACVSGR